MIVYWDTSALVPLLIDEPTSPACREVWRASDEGAVLLLARVEASAALAAGERLGRITATAADHALAALDVLFTQLHVVAIDEGLAREAGRLARRFALRGYDAVHCAAGRLLSSPELVVASGDRALLAAWSELGLASFDPHQQP